MIETRWSIFPSKSVVYNPATLCNHSTTAHQCAWYECHHITNLWTQTKIYIFVIILFPLGLDVSILREYEIITDCCWIPLLTTSLRTPDPIFWYHHQIFLFILWYVVPTMILGTNSCPSPFQRKKKPQSPFQLAGIGKNFLSKRLWPLTWPHQGAILENNGPFQISNRPQL